MKSMLLLLLIYIQVKLTGNSYNQQWDFVQEKLFKMAQAFIWTRHLYDQIKYLQIFKYMKY